MGYPHEICSIGRLKIGDAKSALTLKKFADLRKVFSCRSHIVKNDIDVQEQHEQLPSFYWLPKLHKKPYGSGSLLLLIHSPQNSSLHHLLLGLKQYLSIINNIVIVFITILELIIFGLLTTLLKYWTGYIKLLRPQELENLIVTILLHYIRISHIMP